VVDVGKRRSNLSLKKSRQQTPQRLTRDSTINHHGAFMKVVVMNGDMTLSLSDDP
jgi:hypothetical protein